MRTVPRYRLVTGPSLTVIEPENSVPSPPSSAAPGRHGATRSTSSSAAQARSTGAGTVKAFSSLIGAPP